MWTENRWADRKWDLGWEWNKIGRRRTNGDRKLLNALLADTIPPTTTPFLLCYATTKCWHKTQTCFLIQPLEQEGSAQSKWIQMYRTVFTNHCDAYINSPTHRSKYFHQWWRHQMETFSALLAICVGNSPVPGEFPAMPSVLWGKTGFSRHHFWSHKWALKPKYHNFQHRSHVIFADESRVGF